MRLLSIILLGVAVTGAASTRDWAGLPAEIVIAVADKLDPPSLQATLSTCHNWQRCSAASTLRRRLKSLSDLSQQLRAYLPANLPHDQPLQSPSRIETATDASDGTSRVFHHARSFLTPFLRTVFYQHFLLQPIQDRRFSAQGNMTRTYPSTQLGLAPIFVAPGGDQTEAVVPDSELDSHLRSLVRRFRSERLVRWSATKIIDFRDELARINSTLSVLSLEKPNLNLDLATTNPVAFAISTENTQLLLRLAELTQRPAFRNYLHAHLADLVPESHRQMAAMLWRDEAMIRAESENNQSALTDAHTRIWKILTGDLLEALPAFFSRSVAVALTAQGNVEKLRRHLEATEFSQGVPDGSLGAQVFMQLILAVAAQRNHTEVLQYLLPLMQPGGINKAYKMAQLHGWTAATGTLAPFTVDLDGLPYMATIADHTRYPAIYLYNDKLTFLHYQHI
ncbi:hypothetical protein IWQ60_011434 [Tieghemiomyces parasiticus]|uniref:F-box domain-containing protein n=1 Tax=Tieghemiomyces parasiticus TaxID=78921 RepID=A0A9W7ZNB6_9FUNG|nr:hypothetical protein IWQ60_011434 [Tieghemiomyces parasiticus]